MALFTSVKDSKPILQFDTLDKCEDYPTYDCAKMVSEGVCENDPSEGFRVCAKSCQMCGPGKCN